MAVIGRIENLKPFKKGQSGNPKGYPAGKKNMTTILKEVLDCRIDTKGEHPMTKEPLEEKLSAKEIVLIRLVGEAMKGNIQAIKEVRDMVDGPIKQQIEIEDKTPTKPLSERAKSLAERLANLGLDEKNETPKRKKAG